jgi:hypothetical protein
MIKYTQPALAQKSTAFRYLYYTISGVRLKSFRSWKDAGEPNPFVGKSYRNRQTHREEFLDIFDDLLGDAAIKSRD